MNPAPILFPEPGFEDNVQKQLKYRMPDSVRFYASNEPCSERKISGISGSKASLAKWLAW